MKTKKTDLSVIILNYNTRALLKGCLLSLKKSESKGMVFEVIVIDNASTDGSAKMVKKEFSWVSLIENKRNLGFAAGNNLGIPQAKGKIRTKSQ